MVCLVNIPLSLNFVCTIMCMCVGSIIHSMNENNKKDFYEKADGNDDFASWDRPQRKRRRLRCSIEIVSQLHTNNVNKNSDCSDGSSEDEKHDDDINRGKYVLFSFLSQSLVLCKIDFDLFCVIVFYLFRLAM